MANIADIYNEVSQTMFTRGAAGSTNAILYVQSHVKAAVQDVNDRVGQFNTWNDSGAVRNLLPDPPMDSATNHRGASLLSLLWYLVGSVCSVATAFAVWL